jgi:hypothetical protein
MNIKKAHVGNIRGLFLDVYHGNIIDVTVIDIPVAV